MSNIPLPPRLAAELLWLSSRQERTAYLAINGQARKGLLRRGMIRMSEEKHKLKKWERGRAYELYAAEITTAGQRWVDAFNGTRIDWKPCEATAAPEVIEDE